MTRVAAKTERGVLSDFVPDSGISFSRGKADCDPLSSMCCVLWYIHVRWMGLLNNVSDLHLEHI